MALSVTATGIPARTGGDAVWKMELTWWPPYTAAKDTRFREVHLNAGFLDMVAILTVDEARELNKSLRQHTVLQGMDDLERKLVEDDGKTAWVLVRIEEWSSGLE